jgi:hypothetical protein
MATIPMTPAPAAPRAKRMTLDAITTGDHNKPWRLVVYGPEGVGKTGLAASAPDPVFLCAEQGLEAYPHAKRFPAPNDWTDALDAVESLILAPSPYKTLAIDTMDWLEPMVWAHVCRAAGVNSIEDVGGGWSKGYTKALEHWRVLVSLLERLQDTRKMNAILLAHSQIKHFNDPESEGYDRYTLKMHDKASALFREWASCVLFANYQTFAKTDAKTKRTRGVSLSARMLYTERTAAYDAKNHYNLPPEIPLNWEDLEAAVRAGQPAKPDELVTAITEKLATLGDESLSKQVSETMAKAPGNAAWLAKINDRLNARLAAKGE